MSDFYHFFNLSYFYKLFWSLFRFFYRRRYIVFENWGGYGDSPRKVYEEFVKRGYGRKYGFIWASFDDVDHIPPPVEISQNCRIINPYTRSWKNRCLLNLADACIMCGNSIGIYKRINCFTTFYITHGSPIKDTHSYYFVPKSVDCVICSSPNLVPSIAYGINYPKEKILGLGYPRNDDLLDNSLDINELLGIYNVKFIAWYPTLRKHKNGTMTQAGINQLPLIHNQDIARKINNYARKKRIFIVIKPHRSQDLSIFDGLNLSNIKFINDSFFIEHSCSSYRFLGACSALITDYSSVMYDFTLCDKPIALIWEDIEEYRLSPGIAPDIDKYLECAHKVYQVDDMIQFLDIVSSGKDPLKAIRNQIKKEVNFSEEKDNAKRVTDYIIKMAKL